MIKKCLVCKKEFRTFPSRPHKYCSKDCQFKGTSQKIDKKCKVCKKVFQVVPSKSHSNYCSKECQFTAMTKDKIKKKCKTCGKTFDVFPFKINRAKYCSLECRYKGQNTSKIVKCESCGKEFKIHNKGNARFCSRTCIDLAGEKNPSWKGGKRITSLGYILIYKPSHPFAVNKYIFEHRLVMEKKLGRYLKPEEVVHHINEIKTDNRIENLMLFPNQAAHTKHHAELEKE